MPWTELAAPSGLPIQLTDLKDNLRLTSSDEDNLLTLYIEAATDLFERTTSRRLISRNFRWDQPDFPMESDPCGIELPFAPVSAVTQIQYYDTTGTLTTWASDEYVLDATSHFPRVLLAPNETFPTVQDDRHNGVQVTFTAGYGSTYASVPKGIQWAIILLAAHMFRNRSPVSLGSSAGEIPITLQFAMAPFKLRRA